MILNKKGQRTFMSVEDVVDDSFKVSNGTGTRFQANCFHRLYASIIPVNALWIDSWLFVTSKANCYAPVLQVGPNARGLADVIGQFYVRFHFCTAE